ncbi:MAG: DHA2 family efflux MFS transporter permease subunit [Xanthomonadales bacterium]|nr:DHA2 family efflux MFS transporter permease subunit [Xanthomonadales bacterium]
MSAYFRPPSLALTTVGLALATFMQVLDTTIANVSLPTIAGNLGVSVDQSTWVITSFAVSQAIGLPLTGYLGRRFGEVKVFVWCTLLFVLASFACGLAQSMSMLIFFRVIQGAVCGPMYPVTQSLMISVFPAHKRSMALALIAMVTVVAPIAGPILGGWITESYSWRWIFFINVPIGFFCSFVIRNQLKDKVETIQKPRMDYIGLITLIIGVGLLQVVLDKGNDADWFNSTFIVVASIISVIAIAIFVIWEMTDDEPIVDLKLFRHRNFSAGTLALVLAYAAFFGIALLLPLWMQRSLGYTAIWAGLATAPLGVLPLLLTFFIGKYAGKVDLRWLASISFVVMGSVCFMYSSFNLDVNFMHIAMMQFLLGLGVAFFFMPVLTIVLSDLETSEIASGSGVATFLRTLGGSFAASIITFIWTQRASVHHAQLSEHITPYSPVAGQALNTFGPEHHQQALAWINGMITQQSFQISFNEIFHALGWIFFCLVAVMWLAKPPFVTKAGPAASGGH